MVVILMGVSGCGKTTVGRLLAGPRGWGFYEGDDFHPARNIEKMSRGEPLTEADREPWLEAIAEKIRRCNADGENAVVACSALTQAARETLGVNGRDVRLVYLKGSYETIQRRLQERRGHFMPPALLASQFETLEEPRDALTVEIEAEPGEIAGKIAAALSPA